MDSPQGARISGVLNFALQVTETAENAETHKQRATAQRERERERDTHRQRHIHTHTHTLVCFEPKTPSVSLSLSLSSCFDAEVAVHLSYRIFGGNGNSASGKPACDLEQL